MKNTDFTRNVGLFISELKVMPDPMSLALKTKCAKLRFKHKFDAICLQEIYTEQETAVQNIYCFVVGKAKVLNDVNE